MQHRKTRRISCGRFAQGRWWFVALNGGIALKCHFSIWEKKWCDANYIFKFITHENIEVKARAAKTHKKSSISRTHFSRCIKMLLNSRDVICSQFSAYIFIILLRRKENEEIIIGSILFLFFRGFNLRKRKKKTAFAAWLVRMKSGSETDSDLSNVVCPFKITVKIFFQFFQTISYLKIIQNHLKYFSNPPKILSNPLYRFSSLPSSHALLEPVLNQTKLHSNRCGCSSIKLHKKHSKWSFEFAKLYFFRVYVCRLCPETKNK